MNYEDPDRYCPKCHTPIYFQVGWGGDVCPNCGHHPDEPDEPISALCPKCRGKGCLDCDSGYREITIDLLSGLISLDCEACGASIGGGIAKFYDIDTFKGGPKETKRVCPCCGAKAVVINRSN